MLGTSNCHSWTTKAVRKTILYAGDSHNDPGDSSNDPRDSHDTKLANTIKKNLRALLGANNEHARTTRRTRYKFCEVTIEHFKH